MIGKTFGRWKVLSEAPRGKHYELQYNCECTCGTVSVVRKKPLTSGKSLGCRKCCKNAKRKRPFEYVYNRLAYAAKRYSHTMSLSYEDFLSIIEQGTACCFYCKDQLHWEKYCGSLLARKLGYSLDRKENSVGYTKRNVVPCCKECNYMKSDVYTFEEMLLLSPALILIKERRKNGKS